MVKKISLPDFKPEQILNIRLKSIHYNHFMVFEDYSLDFNGNNFCCFIGLNGSGKTTILDSIQLIFSRFDGYKKDRLVNNLSQLIRHQESRVSGVYSSDDFLITAQIQSSLGNYEIQINKNGFIKDHPEEIKNLVYRLCFYARFDQELNIFQLERGQWNKFKELFESVTGYTIKEITTMFDQGDDPIRAEMLNKYVLSFDVQKPNETIRHTECSDGEKKVIKSFSTLLNKEYIPQIILIDNIEAHIESNRHLSLIKSMKKCFPNSQIFATTHSHQISKNFGERKELYDLRLIKALPIIKRNPWRLYLTDEVRDSLAKLESIKTIKSSNPLVRRGHDILKKILSPKIEEEYLINNIKEFVNQVSQLVILDIYTYYKENE
jgi:predicted ATP-dependent endonuclease of OLD family